MFDDTIKFIQEFDEKKAQSKLELNIQEVLLLVTLGDSIRSRMGTPNEWFIWTTNIEMQDARSEIAVSATALASSTILYFTLACGPRFTPTNASVSMIDMSVMYTHNWKSKLSGVMFQRYYPYKLSHEMDNVCWRHVAEYLVQNYNLMTAGKTCLD